MADLLFRIARADEHEEMSSLALRSKSHWGYSAEFLQACRAELTYDASTCGSGTNVEGDSGDQHCRLQSHPGLTAHG